MSKQLRAVVGARVSVVKGAEKVSHYAQHDSGVSYAERQGHDIVGTFEDLDVSATVSPWNRKDLGPWLNHKVDEWDVMIFSKIDRAFRSIRDCVKLAEWMETHRKILVFADDGLVLNYHNPEGGKDIASMMSELFVYLGSFFAQIELERFKGRSLAAHSALRMQDRWTGGIAPDGFQIIDHTSGKGKGLATDPARKALLHAMADLVIGGESFNGVTDWLNAQGWLTNQDYQRPEDERKGIAWSASEVIKVLTTPATQGYKMAGNGKKARPVLNEEGEQIRLAPPTFDTEKWSRLQSAVQQRKRAPYRVNGASPLSGVAYCGQCKRAASQNIHTRGEKQWRYYRCCKTPKACPNARMPAERVEELLEQTFLDECGHLPVPEWHFVAGEDHTEELDRVKETILQKETDRNEGLIVGEEDNKRFREMMRKLLARREELEVLPQRRSGWQKEDTDETYAQAWERSDAQGRRKLLLDAGVYFEILSQNEWEVVIPEDLKERVSGALPQVRSEHVEKAAEVAEDTARSYRAAHPGKEVVT